MPHIASTGTTTFVLVIVLLAVAGAMALVARWLVHQTRRDSAALGPLERMGQRTWRRGDDARRRDELARSRPAGAPEPAPILDYEPLDPSGAEEVEVEVLHRYDPDDG